MNVERQFRAPFCVYADSECMLQPVHEKRGKTTTVVQVHQVRHVGALLVSTHEEVTRPYTSFYGEDCVEQFLRWLQWLEKDIHNFYSPKFADGMRYCKETICLLFVLQASRG